MDNDLQVYWVDADPQDSVRKLKLMLQSTEVVQLPPFKQSLLLDGDTLVGVKRSTESFPPEDELPLDHYGVTDGSTLRLVRRRGSWFFKVRPVRKGVWVVWELKRPSNSQNIPKTSTLSA